MTVLLPELCIFLQVEITAAKGESAGYQHCFPILQCFQKVVKGT